MKDWQSLSLRQQIAQTIVVRASGHRFDRQIRYPAWEANNAQLQQWLGELGLGGVILLGGSSVELEVRSQQLQSSAEIPLFVAADIEEGIGQRFPGGTWFLPPMALNDIYQRDRNLAVDYAYQMGKVTAEEAQAVGVNWLLAPVVDVNNNRDNPVINIRAFGDRPEVVSALTTAFIAGAKSSSVLTTAKHFPGHGDTAIDSHLELPAILHDESRLANVELPPFVRAIAAGVDSVMTAHLLIPAWDKRHPATLSKSIVTDRLRGQLGFDGLVVTDALIMGGITKYAPPEAVAVMAIEAGCDVLLMPDNPELAIASIYDAVKSHRLSEARIHQSVARIWSAKSKLSHKTDLNRLSRPSATSLVNSILQDSGQTNSLKLAAASQPNSRNLIVVDDLLNSTYLDINTPAIAIPQQFGYQRQIVDERTLPYLSDSRPTLLQIFVRGNPFRGTAGITSEAREIYQQLLAELQVLGLVIYGSPYVMQWFKDILPPHLPWVFSYGQMPQSQAIALDTLFGIGKSAKTRDLSAAKVEGNFGF